MAIHVGKRVLKELTRSKRSKAGLARHIGASYGHMFLMFQAETWDTGKLYKACEYIGVDLFSVLSKDLTKKHAEIPVVEEPTEKYQKSHGKLDITIHVDPDDDTKLLRLIGALSEMAD